MSGSDWERVDTAEFLRDVERARTEPYKLQPHAWKKRRRLPWVVCQGCGLVSLRNKRTEWCARMGCLYARHPDYARRVAS